MLTSPPNVSLISSTYNRIPNILTNRMVLNLRAYDSSASLGPTRSSLPDMIFSPDLWLDNIGFEMGVDAFDDGSDDAAAETLIGEGTVQSMVVDCVA